MCNRQKPFMGTVKNWKRVYDLTSPVGGLGYAIYGKIYKNNGIEYGPIRTSFVVTHDSRTGIIETNNSIYYLIGEGDTV